MKLTIITPTLMRDSLESTCASVTEQTFTDWDHIVIIDRPIEQIDMARITPLLHPQRRFMVCGIRHADGGNRCRLSAYWQAKGEMLYYLDDDNRLADFTSLERMMTLTKGELAFFPITRLGNNFFPPDPPRSGHVDTANFLVSRRLGQWPDTDAYCTDGILIDSLIAAGTGYEMFGHEAPVAIVPTISGGRDKGE